MLSALRRGFRQRKRYCHLIDVSALCLVQVSIPEFSVIGQTTVGVVLDNILDGNSHSCHQNPSANGFQP